MGSSSVVPGPVIRDVMMSIIAPVDAPAHAALSQSAIVITSAMACLGLISSEVVADVPMREGVRGAL